MIFKHELVRDNLDSSNLNKNVCLSVSQLNHSARKILEQHHGNVTVFGEISNLSRPASGHIYFSLKDPDAEIQCAFFRMHAATSNCTQHLKNGVSIEVTGKVTIYPNRGQYQIIASRISLHGEGLLKKQYLELKNKLENLGLFDQDKKIKIPPFPKTIGVISSPNAAGFIDFARTLKSRLPCINIRLFPSLVQGKSAGPDLCKALENAEKDPEISIIVFCRGGGSIEDLWCFNDEDLAQAIAKCKKPVISAVGHEIDYTICDFVSDLRCATPTMAAVCVSPEKKELLEVFINFDKNIFNFTKQLLQKKTWELEKYKIQLKHPKEKIIASIHSINYLKKSLLNQTIWHLQSKQQKLDSILHNFDIKTLKKHTNLKKEQTLALTQKLINSAYLLLNKYKQLLAITQNKILSLDPKRILAGGYTIVEQNNKIIDSASKIQKKDILQLRFADGIATVEVNSVEVDK